MKPKNEGRKLKRNFVGGAWGRKKVGVVETCVVYYMVRISTTTTFMIFHPTSCFVFCFICVVVVLSSISLSGIRFTGEPNLN